MINFLSIAKENANSFLIVFYMNIKSLISEILDLSEIFVEI